MRLYVFVLILSSVCAFGQTEDSLIKEVHAFQAELHQHYTDKESSPLKKKERRKFKGHQFFPIDLNYRIEAEVMLIENPDTIVMPTSAGTEKKYIRYAELHFVIQGDSCVLIAYQSIKAAYSNYLFIPFRDKTSGFESYGGGRYIDMGVPEGETVILNFNLAYNPYCAYTTGWFCPLPPDENTLSVEIKAGLKVPLDH